MPVSLSSEILREQQEYERTATTVVNAYVRPLMARYVDDLRRGLGDAELTIMQSSGGVMSAEDAAERPVYALESGPAAGVVAARALAQALGHANAIAFDMGGTTAKASLIENGRVSRSQEYEVGASLSAGVAAAARLGRADPDPDDRHRRGRRGRRLDRVARRGGRRCNVGPRSAGASPGPACYGLGGDGADGHRRERRARLHPGGPDRRRRHRDLARARGGGARARSASRRAAFTTSRTRR